MPMFPFALKDDRVQWEGIILQRMMKKLKSFLEEGIKVVALGKFVEISNSYEGPLLLMSLKQ
ncbi:hypothetical protein CEV08_00960 [Bartonella tribocorum]|uniref:Uncharacterized protein n=2 Tax=Bartonella tribocorum TaxID=85701 RepID=A0A2M6UYB1_9HYPH|nr:hypothetical protein CEV08_00960 [Bartonella tribocorum]